MSSSELFAATLRRFIDTAAHNSALGVGNGCWGLAMLSKAGIPFFSSFDGGPDGQQSPQAGATTRALVHAAVGAGAAQICALLHDHAQGGQMVSGAVRNQRACAPTDKIMAP